MYVLREFAELFGYHGKPASLLKEICHMVETSHCHAEGEEYRRICPDR